MRLGLGVGTAILITSESGQQARQRIGTKLDERAEHLRERAEELKVTAASFVESGKLAVNRVRETLDIAVDAGKQAYSEALKS